MNVTIRKGIQTDVASVLGLIKQLATYEKAPNEVTLTENELMQDAFGDKPICYFFVAEMDAEIIGIALYYIKYSTWKGKCVFLEDIIVDEKYRMHGIGKKLFTEVAKVAAQMGVKRMEWQVLDWNSSAIEFYKKLNSKFDGEWINCKLTDVELKSYNL
jgi:GNAT superfamily N-acetyltransferase